MIVFVGAGSGAEDLITVRGQRYLREADVIVFAGSLVNPDLLENKKESCEVYNSALMTLEEVMEVLIAGEKAGKKVVRLHTGDPCLYGAIREQMDLLDKEQIAYEVCPGVSSFCGAAAALHAEYTLPGVSQSVVITRMAGRTPVPEKESIRQFAAHQATMVIFLSTGMLEKLQEELMAGGYAADTPAAIVYKATWPDEKVRRCTVATLADTAKENGIRKTALIVVGNILEGEYQRSELYNPAFSTEFRQATAERQESSCIQPRETETEGTGRIYVTGLGPGAGKQLTFEAKEVLEHCSVIVGYPVYTELIREEFPDKQYLTTPMCQETQRCYMAFREAAKGQNVAMICSGDAGVYGMAGLMYEIGAEYPEVEIEVIPGVTAANGGAAVLGAPLMHDFAVISLSDLLTPWEKIERRLRAAAMADFVICLYNPSSRKRKDYLQKACDILMEYKSPDTICGTVRNIGRKKEESRILSLRQLRDTEVDMFTTVYIGNEQTKQINGKMVTPRGYRNV